MTTRRSNDLVLEEGAPALTAVFAIDGYHFTFSKLTCKSMLEGYPQKSDETLSTRRRPSRPRSRQHARLALPRVRPRRTPRRLRRPAALLSTIHASHCPPGPASARGASFDRWQSPAIDKRPSRSHLANPLRHHG